MANCLLTSLKNSFFKNYTKNRYTAPLIDISKCTKKNKFELNIIINYLEIR
jgi:hypothetical protein